MENIENAMPSMFYRDPVDAVDEIRRLRDIANKQAERDRLNKGRRIRALVKLAMKGIRR